MSNRRVVVTGLGILSPLGNTVEGSWKNILAGKNPVRKIKYFDTKSYDTKFAASLSDFKAEDYLEPKEIRRLDKFIQYGVVASKECIIDSGIEDNNNIFSYLASLGEDTIDLAESGNDIALSIIQEGTRYVSEYIKSIAEKMEILNSDVMLFINGSIIKNNFYRNLLEESLQYDFNKIHWISSALSPAYGAGIMAGKYKNININLTDIIKGASN